MTSEPKCPKCGGDPGKLYYSHPMQADCEVCEHRFAILLDGLPAITPIPYEEASRLRNWNRDRLHELRDVDGWMFDTNRGWKKANERLTVWVCWSKEGPDITVVCRELPHEGRIELWNDDVEFIHMCYVEVHAAYEVK